MRLPCNITRNISPIASLGCSATLLFPRMSIVCTMCKVVNGNVYAKLPIVKFLFILFFIHFKLSLFSSWGLNGNDFQDRWDNCPWINKIGIV